MTTARKLRGPFYELTEEMYALRTRTNKWVAIDFASGGYPFEVEEWYRAKLWSTRFEAEDYSRSFKDEHFTVCIMQAKFGYLP